MYRPSMYSTHDKSLHKFAELFNKCSEYTHIKIKPIEEEAFDNDGIIVNENTGESLGFDWEYRDKYFSNCDFKFPSLGQFERKLIKPSIKLSLQCDSTETGVAVGWHEDWLNENRINLALATDSVDEKGTVRYTKSFRIYSYEKMAELKKMINKAFETGKLNHKVFS